MHHILSQLYYLPPIQVFAYYAKADTILLEVNEHYQKGSYRNRCYIVGANGIQRLSIPLSKGKHSQMPIREVELAYYELWHKQHWKSIQSAYGNAPFFFYYSDAFEAIYQEKHTTLWSFNKALLSCVFKLLHWDKLILETDDYQKKALEGFVDIRGLILNSKGQKANSKFQIPKNKKQIANSKGQIPNSKKQIANSKSQILSTTCPEFYASYPQVFTERHGFIANLSILDLLFCKGPQSELYLTGLWTDSRE